MDKNKTKLSALHWFVYGLLTNTPYTSTNPISQREIFDKCKEAGFKISWSEEQNHHNDHCRYLNRIIMRLNESMEVDKLIHHHGYRYYVCSYEEALEIIELKRKKIVLAGMRISRVKHKLMRHNQGKLLTNLGNPMTPEAKPFHEAVVEEER